MALEHSRADDLLTATCFHFYEHLSEEPLVRKQMPWFMSRAKVLALSEIFKHRIGPQEFRALLNEFAT